MQIDASDPSEDAAPVSEDGASRAATAQVKRIAETAQFASMGFPSVGWKHDPVIRKILREAGLIPWRINHDAFWSLAAHSMP